MSTKKDELYRTACRRIGVLEAENTRLKADADRLAELVRVNINDIADYVDDGSPLTGDDMPYFNASAALERIRAALKAHEEEKNDIT